MIFGPQHLFSRPWLFSTSCWALTSPPESFLSSPWAPSQLQLQHGSASHPALIAGFAVCISISRCLNQHPQPSALMSGYSWAFSACSRSSLFLSPCLFDFSLDLKERSVCVLQPSPVTNFFETKGKEPQAIKSLRFEDWPFICQS